MHDSSQRLAIAMLLLAGCSTLAISFSAPTGMQPAWAAGPLAPLVWHRHLLLAVLGAGLLAAVFLPGLRVAAAIAAIVDKAGFLAASLVTGASLSRLQWVDAAMLAGLAVAAAVLARRARQEARWEGVLPLRPEA
ncbi:MAG: hypothetical protein ABIT82_09295 [Ramlibacter sp.]